MSYADQRLFSPGKIEHEHQDDARTRMADEAMLKRVVDTLGWHYPGHPWRVEASHSQGVARVSLMAFAQFAYVIKIADLKADPGMKRVIKAGGEILERYNMPRAGFDFGRYCQSVKILKPEMNRNGRLIGA